MTDDWKFDKAKYFDQILKVFLRYGIMPLAVYLVLSEYMIIDSNTYFAIVIVFLLINLVRAITYFPKYRIEKSSH